MTNVPTKDWAEQLLEDVAREVDFHCTEDDAHSSPQKRCRIEGECAALADEVAKVLKARLLPVLLAGQAMRESRVNISDDAMAWDAAVKAALGDT